MNRRVCLVVAGIVIGTGTLAAPSRLGAQPGEPLKCVGVAAFTTEANPGLVTVVRAWEDGSLDARQFGAGIGSPEGWSPLR